MISPSESWYSYKEKFKGFKKKSPTAFAMGWLDDFLASWLAAILLADQLAAWLAWTSVVSILVCAKARSMRAMCLCLACSGKTNQPPSRYPHFKSGWRFMYFHIS